MATITVQPNQSMLDVILMAMGTLEGGMCFCALNDVAISDTPEVGTVYQVPDGSQTTLVAFDSDTMVDPGVLQYWAQNGITVGNLGTPYNEMEWDGGGGVEWDGSGGGVEWDG